MPTSAPRVEHPWWDRAMQPCSLAYFVEDKFDFTLVRSR
jgi:hypothetical protein